MMQAVVLKVACILMVHMVEVPWISAYLKGLSKIFQLRVLATEAEVLLRQLENAKSAVRK